MESDAPIQNPDDPRQKIASVIGKLAASPPDDRSLIIGIYGPWGSGKTTMMHMVFEAAQLQGIPPNHLIHFSAWQAQSGDLTQEYFRELARGLGVVANEQTLQLIIHYANVLTSTGKLAEKLLAAASRVVLVLGLFGIGLISIIESLTLKLIFLVAAVAVCTAGPLLFGTGWTLRNTEKLLRLFQEKRNRGVDLKSPVNDRLAALGQPLIVAIDDIDRVNPQSALDILLLAKNNARFTNLTYLLLMDHSLMASTLGNGDTARGKELLEKIVDIQVSLGTVED